MSEPITTAHKAESVPTGHKRVECSGPASGRHPKVFLTMVDDAAGTPNHVVCPYCSRTFVYNPKLAATTPSAH
ncbi:MAG: zinc-finger domain-containing protein [Proteobacteria bacterium]|nr:zinc-finger domain-containing protein [Pseudomonadota bacterium]